MADYTIYALSEANLTISNGAILDGVTQGDGSHLQDETITLNNNSWEAINISDASTDTNFADNDGNQRLNGDQTIFGTFYDDDTQIEAEYTLIVEDPDGNTYTLIGFNIRDSSPAFSQVEGLAFIGAFPPIGVELTVIETGEGPANNGPNATPSDSYATPPCFTAGTLIDTPFGPRAVETLKPGDLVLTNDNGPMPLKLLLSTSIHDLELDHRPEIWPIRIKKDAFGKGLPARDLVVSPQHQLLIGDWRTQIMFGTDQVLASAKHLVNETTIRVVQKPQGVTYYHLLFDTHQLVYAHGLLSESFLPGETSMGGLDAPTLAAFFDTFGVLRSDMTAYGPSARRSLRRHEAQLLSA